jgi:ribosomal protein L37AE/L43A
MVKLSPDKYTQHGKLWRHVGAGPAIKESCVDCGDDLYNKQAKFPFEGGWICKHCKVKKQHGVVDPKTCFQGSVITLED